MAYSEVTVSGYNASPPPDDGSTGASNQVSWAGIKTKLTDPLKTALESIDDNVASAITAVEGRLDTLEGFSVTSTLYAPSGTIMLFRQTSAPTGWTKDETNYNDHALRVTTGTPSVYASGIGMSTMFQSSAYSTAATTLTTPQMPAHTHTVTGTALAVGDHNHGYTDGGRGSKSVENGSGESCALNGSTSDTTGSAGSHAHSLSGTALSSGGGGSHDHTVDLRLNYVDVIFATKV